MRKFLVLMAMLIAVPFGLVACGDDEEEATTAASESTESSGAGATIEISETEYALEPSEASAAAGQVTFTVTNDGEIPHNLEVEGDGVEEVTETIEAGGSDELTLELEPGTYEIYCSIADHQEQGMEGELTVE